MHGAADTLRTEVAVLKADMVTKYNLPSVCAPLLAPIEARLSALEQAPAGSKSPELQMLRQ